MAKKRISNKKKIVKQDNIKENPLGNAQNRNYPEKIPQKIFYNNSLLHILLIILAVFVAYSNSFNADFTFDDLRNITENKSIRDLGHFLKELIYKPLNLSSRYFGYLTLAVNFKLHKFEVYGYHLINFLIHLSTSILVYAFIVFTFKTPYLKESKLKEYNKIIAFFSGLLFAVHPIQTQAVTYIIQRFASLATFFYLLSIIFYIRWRLLEQDVSYGYAKFKKNFFYFLCLISIFMAMKTKEISFTIPLIIIIYELLFFKGNVKKRLLKLLPLIMTILIIPLTFIKSHTVYKIAVNNIDAIIRLETEVSRWDYLFTQFRVLITYLRLMFFPVNQNLDYDYPLYHSFFSLEVFLSFIFLLAIFFAGLFLLIFYRKTSPHLLIISFGIFWFFITISVESSFIPILDLIYEHRMYLPSIGLIIAFCIGIFNLANSYHNKWVFSEKAVIISLTIISLVLMTATFNRNKVWSNNISLWEDVVKKSPQKARPHYNLGTVYLEKYFKEKTTFNEYLLNNAIKEFNLAIRLNPKHAGAYNNLGNAYIIKGMIDKAIESYEASLKLKPDNLDAIGNLGNIYLHKGLIDKAIECYLLILKSKPDNADAHFNLGIAYFKKQENNEALKEFQTALKLNPDMKEAKDYIDKLYYSQNKQRKSNY
ncbi:MAG: tetratricopeptide repeat protein [Nitrospirae bacterium]|jgi:tetratricopeptide (TPR) repeat protein|nr:tetratricopeptide repeat protein [Nitrospirota bacterium]